MTIQEDLKAYIDNELSPERRIEVENAIAASEELQREVEELRTLSHLIGATVVQASPAGLDQTLRQLEKRRPRPLLIRYSWVAGLACAILVAVLARPSRMFADSGADAKSEDVAATSKALPRDDAKGGVVSPQASAKMGDFDSTLGNGEEKRAYKGGLADVASPAQPQLQTNVPRFTPLENGTAAKLGEEEMERNRRESPSASNPMLIRTGDISLRVDSVDKALARVTSDVKALRGYIESNSRSSDEYSLPIANLTIRVPEKSFDDALSRLRSLGNVASESSNSEDVTAQVADTEARLKVKRAEEESYVTMLRAARKVGDLLEIKDRLSSVREEIESMEATRKALRSRATYSTISVQLSQKREASKPPVPPSWFEDAWAGAMERGAGLGRWLTELGLNLLVFAPIWLPLVLLLWWAGNRRRR